MPQNEKKTTRSYQFWMSTFVFNVQLKFTREKEFLTNDSLVIMNIMKLKRKFSILYSQKTFSDSIQCCCFFLLLFDISLHKKECTVLCCLLSFIPLLRRFLFGQVWLVAQKKKTFILSSTFFCAAKSSTNNTIFFFNIIPSSIQECLLVFSLFLTSLPFWRFFHRCTGRAWHKVSLCII